MSTPADKAAARAAERERRQARIKASAESRLAKITGSAGTQDFKGPVASPAAAAAAPRAAAPARTVPPADDADPEVPSGDQLLKFLSQSSGAPQAADDPLLAYLSQAMGQAPGAGGAVPPTPAAQSQSVADAQNRSRNRSRNEFAYDAVHFLGSVAIGVYAALVNPWSLTLVFVALQAVLVTSRAVLGHHAGLASVPMIAPFLGMLPKARQRQLSLAGSLFHAARDAYRDLAITIFIYGLCALGGSDYARPI